MHPLSQALQEYPKQAALYQLVHQLLGAAEHWQTVQMWTRLGYGPAIGSASRRRLEAHLVTGVLSSQVEPSGPTCLADHSCLNVSGQWCPRTALSRHMPLKRWA
jgi:hypothetical protein